MSNGLDSLANQQAPAYLINILESHPEETYTGQEFAGTLRSNSMQDMSNQNDSVVVPGHIDGNLQGMNNPDLLGTSQSLNLTSAPQVEMNSIIND